MGLIYQEDEGRLASETCPPRLRWQVRAARWALTLVVAATCALAGAQFGMEAESKKWRRESLEWNRHHAEHHDEELRVRGRGELWLRCPNGTTWYNYTGARVIRELVGELP